MQKWFIDNQNWIMNLIALGSFLYEPVTAYLSKETFNWRTFGSLIFVSILAWLKGKYPLALVNSSKISVQQERDITKQGYATSSDLKQGD